jgi:hypothetical protein
MMTQRAILCLAVLLAACSVGRAEVIVYATPGPPDGPDVPSNLYTHHGLPSIGSFSFFDIFIRTDVLVAGMNLDVLVQGDSIALTSATVPNYSGPRWASTTNGVVLSPPGNEAIGLEGFAIPGFGSTGIRPNAPDNGYNASVNAFHFARVHYNIVDEGTSKIFFRIGANETSFGAATELFLGIGDPPICYTSCAAVDMPNIVPEGIVFVGVIPEPAALSLFCLAILAGAGLRRRHKEAC